MVSLEDDFIDRVIVVELDESESAFLPCVLFSHNVDIDHSSEFFEVLSQVTVFDVLLQPSQEDFLHRGLRLRFARLFSRHGPLRFHFSPINFVGTSCLCFIHHACLGIGDESEATRTLRLWISHHDTIHDLSPGLEVGSERLFRRLVVQPADEQLPELLRFFAITVSVFMVIRSSIRPVPLSILL